MPGTFVPDLRGAAASGTMHRMLSCPRWPGLRLAVLATMLTLSFERRLVEPLLPVAGAPASRFPPRDAHTWALQTGGWLISVDGAEVELPSLAQQTRPLVHARGPQPLSPYDQLIAHHAEEQGLDWRLVAALIFEESRFVPDAVSEAGAYGLMQVRPIAAAAVGAAAFQAPADNIRTGARYLRQLSETFTESRGRDHLALVLGAYNMGPGHLRDAQRLARRVGYDPAIWRESMELMLPLLAEPAIYRELPNGFASGEATVAYVNRVLDRYDAYRRRFGARPAALDDEDSDQAASANG